MATKYYLYYVEGEDEKLQRKQRCLTDLIESGFLICETGDDVMKEIKFGSKSLKIRVKTTI